MFKKMTELRYLTENVTDELIRLENLVKMERRLQMPWR